MKTIYALATLLALASTSAMAAEPALKSALDGNAPPFAQPKMDGSIEGLTVDMTAEISKRLNRDITIDAMSFSALLPALQAGTYDMLSVPLTVTQERSDAFLLTEGIWSGDLAFVIPANAPALTSYDQLKGKVIAANKGNADEKWAREQADKIGWTIESYASLTDAAQAVQAGRADAAIMNVPTALTLAKKNPALKAADLRESTGRYFSYAIPKSSPELRQQVEYAIECIKADGTAAKLYDKWLGEVPAEGSLEVTPQPGIGPVGLGNYDPTPHELTCN
ncbi:transporter substrate-binding domain-containing protein [Martelella sp. HB161492]|uniref:substrate-binding periplasmic protein n=1 Tax=Martelella sp. HB161492 TaxID=2720726 RepID=UPI0015900C0A|nr:transporter substrate-binding domain-containing protein [Martelella sp. HB161492]